MTEVHTVHHKIPDSRKVQDALDRAERLEELLPYKVLPFAEDWDLILLAHEVKRLQKMIDIP